MFSEDLESRLRGMFRKKVKNAEDVVETITRKQPDAEKARPQYGERTDQDDNDDAASSNGSNVPLEELNDVARRQIVRQWPRDPNGPVMESTSQGKVAGNDQLLWGATVLDFFMVRRVPGIANYLTISTGSKLAAYMKSIGETEYAKDEIAWAEEEADPCQLLPCNMGTLMRTMDLGLPQPRELLDMESGKVSPPRLESRVPLYLLPQKLIVHDPAGTLSVNSWRHTSSEPSTPRVYKLKLIPEALAAAEKERALVEEAHKSAPKNGKFYLTASDDINTGKTTSGPVIEPVFATYPSAPPPPLITSEAHLYLNKSEKLGEGHHSHVFRAMWEVPRELFEKPHVCDTCFETALFKVLRDEAPDTEINETVSLEHQIEALLIAIAAKHGRTGTMSLNESVQPGLNLRLQGPAIEEDRPIPIPFTNPNSVHEQSYEGSCRTIPVPVEWCASSNCCEHEDGRNDAGLMFKVSVAAKLSKQGDYHLEREAVNYQNFPGHFFEHWSGYNVVPPNHDPTPALAIVPQFYGYYVPEEKSEEYLSPIMLIEDCGTPIEVEKLDIDDRHECASLLFRMHAAGWVHGSFFPRNVLMSHGDITQWPVFRKKEDRRFRLIDFGRSTKTSQTNPATTSAEESWDCQEMFHILNVA